MVPAKKKQPGTTARIVLPDLPEPSHPEADKKTRTLFTDYSDMPEILGELDDFCFRARIRDRRAGVAWMIRFFASNPDILPDPEQVRRPRR